MHCRLPGLLRYVVNPASRRTPQVMATGASPRGDVVAADKPLVEEMAALAGRAKEEEGKAALVRDTVFYRWRFANPRNRYVFYYALQNGSVAGFVVLGVYPNNSRVYVLDYAAQAPRILDRLLGHIIRRARLDILMINRFAFDRNSGPLFERHGFKKDKLLKKVDRARYGEYPLLIRPVKKNFSAADFIVADVDLRKFSNWSLKPFCSDYA
jgi:hypothetical protein